MQKLMAMKMLQRVTHQIQPMVASRVVWLPVIPVPGTTVRLAKSSPVVDEIHLIDGSDEVVLKMRNRNSAFKMDEGRFAGYCEKIRQEGWDVREDV